MKGFELLGIDLMIEEPDADAQAAGARVWLLEVNSFPGSAPFDQWHGKSTAFHEGIVGLAASLVHLMHGSQPGQPDEGARWCRVTH